MDKVKSRCGKSFTNLAQLNIWMFCIPKTKESTIWFSSPNPQVVDKLLTTAMTRPQCLMFWTLKCLQDLTTSALSSSPLGDSCTVGGAGLPPQTVQRQEALASSSTGAVKERAQSSVGHTCSAVQCSAVQCSVSKAASCRCTRCRDCCTSDGRRSCSSSPSLERHK